MTGEVFAIYIANNAANGKPHLTSGPAAICGFTPTDGWFVPEAGDRFGLENTVGCTKCIARLTTLLKRRKS